MKHFVFPYTRSRLKAFLFLHTYIIQARGSWYGNIYVYIYSYYVPTCGAFSIVTKTTVLKCVWPMYMCNITLEFEYLNQRFAINGALFSPKNNISVWIYWWWGILFSWIFKLHAQKIKGVVCRILWHLPEQTWQKWSIIFISML